MSTVTQLYTDFEVSDYVEPAHYISQFLLGPVSTTCPDGWKRAKIDAELELCTHPELNVTQTTSNDHSLTLIGFILDPDSPHATDADIVTRLLEASADLEALITSTSRLGGRWILIATYGEESYLFHDALGLRQVFYTDPGLTEDIWAMSQPKIGADLLNLSIDEAAQSFIDSYEFRQRAEYRWPGESSPYKEIKHLQPNHYLNLNRGSSHRYWPNRHLKKIDLNEAKEELSSLLKGLIEAAALRFDLALAVTAGMDSRLALAASKDVREKITPFTVRQWMKPDDDADITVPAKLLNQLGLKHDIIKALVTTSPAFSKAFKNNVFMSHDHYGSDAEAILKHFSRKKVAVTGSGAEVGRCGQFYTLPAESNGKLTAEYLSTMQQMGSNKFAVQHFQHWLEGHGDLYNVNPFELLFWEQSSGNWLAMTQLEFDIAWKDIFTPYNCRAALVTMLSIDEKYKEGSENILFLEAIKHLWPEVLSEPINPHERPEKISLPRRLKKRIKRLLLG